MEGRLWRIRNSVIPLDRVCIMGIVNVTPDSFFDGGKYQKAENAVQRAHELVRLGANIIDIGGQSTRPGFLPISAEEEWERVRPVLEQLRGNIGARLSIDTFYPDVASRALEAGVDIINDVTGLRSAEMRRLAATTGCGSILMCDEDITRLYPDGADDTGVVSPPCLNCVEADLTVEAVRKFFGDRLEQCAAEGIDPQTVVLDCGIGFGKSRAQDYVLLHRMGECRYADRPILVAASNKRVVRRYWSQLSADEGTRCAHEAAIKVGADMVRVHRVHNE